jgi:hypothetical protein
MLWHWGRTLAGYANGSGRKAGEGGKQTFAAFDMKVISGTTL